ncbi:hypothetical protein JCM6882_006680 [Rhodosporidiobolus microsporus]
MDGGNEMEPSASVSSLRARFEQLGMSKTPATPSPTPPPLSPKPSSNGTKPPLALKPSGLKRNGAAGGAKEEEDTTPDERNVEEAVLADGAEQAVQAAPVKQADPPARRVKPIVAPRPPSIVIAAPSPALSAPAPPLSPAEASPLPSPALPEPLQTASPDPFESLEQEEAPPTPLAIRPALSSKPSLRRPAPPPPAQRARPSFASTLPRASASEEPPEPVGAPTLPNLQPQVPSPPVQPAPSPALSVKSLASRFTTEPSPLSRTPSSAGSIVRSPSPLDGEGGSPPPGEAEMEDEEEDSPPGSVYTSSDEDEGEDAAQSGQPTARPAIPPRPVLSQPAVLPSQIPQPPPSPRSAAPPRLPTRSCTTSSAVSTGSTHLTASPLSVSPLLSRSPSNSISNGSAAPPSLALPPRRENSLSPSTAGSAPALPARKSSAPLPLPPRPTAAPSPSTPAPPVPSASLPYIPPPPPTRNAPPSGSITPLRPGLGANGEDGSSDEEGEDSVLAKSQEFPDATFANRRPPILRNRRMIQSQNQFSAVAVRGQRVVTAHHKLHIWYPSASSTVESLSLGGDQQKFLSLAFRAPSEDSPEDDGRFLWCGTKEGDLYEVDTEHRVVTQVRQNAHAHPVHWIFRAGRAMVTVDESGKVSFWGSSLDNNGRAADLSSGAYKQHRVPEKQNWAATVGDELWTSSGPATKQGSSAVSMRSPQIRVFDPSGARGGNFSFLPRPLVTPESAGHVGAVTAHAIVPHQDHLVYLGHDNGYVSVWDRATYACVLVQRISPYSISAMCGVRRYLWAGYRTGQLYVYDVESEPWTVKKAWKAHKDPVVRLVVDPASLWQDETLQVASASNDTVCLWDGFLREDWLDSELHLRQPDYCTFRTIRSLCISWNIDACRPGDLHGTVDNLEFLEKALTSVESPDIISVGFQEVVDLNDKKLTAKSMLMGKKKTAEKFSDGLSSAYRQWHDKLVQAVRLAMPADTPYSVVHARDMIGLFSCIFVKSSELPRLRDVALITVKTGMGVGNRRHGNKGGILSRFVIDDSSICFINCHLAAGQSHRRQRDKDLVDILEDKASFSELGSSSPGAYTPGGSGQLVMDHELTILSGDLNYRIDASRDVVVSAVASGNSESLLQHDQLLKNLATNQSFRLRSFKEPAIHFPPTYKYDPGTDQYDSSPKRRIPAWCDRVLYRADRADKVIPLQYRRWEVNVSDHRPISAAFDLRIKSVVPDKRAQVWAEVEAAWFAVESSILEEVRKYYTGK